MTQYKINVEGMHCAGCVGRVERVIAANGGADVSVDLEGKCAVFSSTPEKKAEIVDAINSIGFTAE